MRSNKVILQIAIACAALCCTAIALDQPATTDSISGDWAVTFIVEGQSVSGRMGFHADGEKLGGSVETQHTGQGKLNGGAWSHNKLSGIYVFQEHEAIAIAGQLREGKLAGVFCTEGRDGKWEAVRAGARP